MNAREGMDLVKMAITAMLVTLVIGAGFFAWNKMATPMGSLEKSLESATLSAATERLYEMQDMSTTARSTQKYEDFPLVSNVCNILSEYNEDSLLFVYCTAHDASNNYVQPNYFTYENVVINNFPGFPGTNGNIPTNPYPNTQQPVTYAVKYLLPYSQYRCDVKMVDYSYKGNNYVGVIVDVIAKEV